MAPNLLLCRDLPRKGARASQYISLPTIDLGLVEQRNNELKDRDHQYDLKDAVVSRSVRIQHVSIHDMLVMEYCSTDVEGAKAGYAHFG